MSPKSVKVPPLRMVGKSAGAGMPVYSVIGSSPLELGGEEKVLSEGLKDAPISPPLKSALRKLGVFGKVEATDSGVRGRGRFSGRILLSASGSSLLFFLFRLE